MSRTSITIDVDVGDRLEACKRDDETWTELMERAADAIEGDETAGGPDESTMNALREEHIDDIAAETASRVVRDLETALR